MWHAACVLLMSRVCWANYLRVGNSEDVGSGNSSYIVALSVRKPIQGKEFHYHRCSGVYIASTWVLTAGHCVHKGNPNETYIRYKEPDKATYLYRKIIKFFWHPQYSVNNKINFDFHYMLCRFDIGLILTQESHLAAYGRLISIDPSALFSKTVTFVGFGSLTGYLYSTTSHGTFLMGEGVIMPCPDTVFNPVICIAPSCTTENQEVLGGDSGGPIFYKNYVVGVNSGLIKPMVSSGTPVSPFLDWIIDTINNNNDKEREYT